MSTWTFDNSHSLVGFSAKHMMISTVRGRFDDFDGTVEYDPANPAAAKVDVTIRTASVDTNWQQRDDHLRSPDFFDAATFPAMTFRSTSVEPLAADRARIHGDLTIKDVTKPVTLDVELVGEANGFDGKRNLAFEAKARIDREQWGLTWNMGLETGGVVVGKTITIELDVRAVEQLPVAATPERAAASLTA
jgi:polyisoprenoid-binding protein YceI